MSLALSKGTCGRTFGMANQSGGRAILCRKRASGRHHMDKTGRKTGNQWLTKAGNDKEDTYAMACILLKSIGAPGRNRTHGPHPSPAGGGPIQALLRRYTRNPMPTPHGLKGGPLSGLSRPPRTRQLALYPIISCRISEIRHADRI